MDEDSNDNDDPPMLDPDWTPARGISHALRILEILKKKEKGESND